MEKYGKYWALVKGTAHGLIACLVLAAPAGAQCRLALVLAMDVSSSVNAEEYDLQRQGLANALNAAPVRDVILFGPGSVALSVFEWSGRHRNQVIQDWVLLDQGSTLDEVIATLRDHPRSEAEFPTAMGAALGYASVLLGRAPDCRQYVIDMSGDGANNDGYPPAIAYRHFDFQDVTVNGLAILGSEAGLVHYYLNNVIHGPGAFIETALNHRDFQNAMERKLLRELSTVVGNLQ